MSENISAPYEHFQCLNCKPDPERRLWTTLTNAMDFLEFYLKGEAQDEFSNADVQELLNDLKMENEIIWEKIKHAIQR